MSIRDFISRGGRAGVIGGTLLLISVSSFAFAQDSGETANQAVRLREGPSLSSSVLGLIPPCTAVDILQELADWYKIKISPDLEGFVSRKYVKKTSSRKKSKPPARAGCRKMPPMTELIRQQAITAYSSRNWYEVIRLIGEAEDAPGFGLSDAYILGVSCMESSQEDRAEAVLKRALRKPPVEWDLTVMEAYQKLIEILQAQKKWVEICQTAEMIIHKFPASTKFRNIRGQALLELKHFSAARDEFQAILLSNPDDGEAKIGLAHILRKMNDPDGAEKELRELVSQHPAFLKGWIELSGLLSSRNRYEEAFLNLNEGLDHNPESRILLDEISRLDIEQEKARTRGDLKRQKDLAEQKIRNLGIEKKTFSLVCRLKPRLFEIQLATGEHCLLLMHTRRFDSPGEYSMLLNQGDDVPVTYSPRNGGFTQAVRMFLEPKPQDEAEYQRAFELKKELDASLEKLEKNES